VSSFVLAFSAVAFAAPLSNFHGVLSDPSGAVIPNAQVELLENGVPVASVATDAKGYFSISWKPEPGLRLRVSHRGFRTIEKALDTQAHADEPSENLVLQLASFTDQITVTSTGSPTPESELGTTVTVLDRADYQGTRDIQEGLRLLPGLQALQTGQAGGTTAVYIRGGAGDANKVLIDGIPVNDIGGTVEFANIASASVAQVEVLRGPNSALYGSDALAGVISLTTARGSTPAPLFTYFAEGGNFGTYHQEGTAGGKYGKLDYLSSYSRFDSSNSIPGDKYHNGTFTGNFGWSISPTSSLRATVHHDQVASGQPGAIELYGLPGNAGQANEDAYFGVTWDDRSTANWHNQLQYGGLRLRVQYVEFAPAGIPQYDESGNLLGYLGAPVTIRASNGYTVSGQAMESNDGPPYPYAYPGSTDKDFVYAQSDYRFNPHLLGLVAFRYEDERGYSGGPSSSIERGNYSYTFQLQGDVLNRLFYTVGSGLEDSGLFGIAATPRASLAWQVARKGIFGGTKLRVSFGEGIKEPALFDQTDSLYALLSGLPATPGSPSGAQLIAQYHVASIGPENSRSYDGGIDQLLLNGNSRVSLTLFHNEFTNGVEYLPPQGLLNLGVPSAIAAAAVYGATVNSEAYRAQGLEAEIEHQVTRDLFVRAGYTYVDARIQRSFSSGPSFNTSFNFSNIPIGVFSPLVGARPFRIAPHTGYFEAGYRHKSFFAGLRGTLVGSRDDSDFLTSSDPKFPDSMLLPNRNLDGAYQKMDLTSSYQANRHVSIEGNFQNLLCEHYSEAFGYPSLPFMFRLGMKFTLGGESWSRK
jgi:iron complex outermembrane receptor protein/vitamin B12 transporter